jgi:hypothetical protein
VLPKEIDVDVLLVTVMTAPAELGTTPVLQFAPVSHALVVADPVKVWAKRNDGAKTVNPRQTDNSLTFEDVGKSAISLFDRLVISLFIVKKVCSGK